MPKVLWKCWETLIQLDDNIRRRNRTRRYFYFKRCVSIVKKKIPSWISISTIRGLLHFFLDLRDRSGRRCTVIHVGTRKDSLARYRYSPFIIFFITPWGLAFSVLEKIYTSIWKHKILPEKNRSIRIMSVRYSTARARRFFFLRYLYYVYTSGGGSVSIIVIIVIDYRFIDLKKKLNPKNT